MVINISVRHTELPEKTKNQFERKTAKLYRYFNKIQSIDLIIDFQKSTYKVEFLIKSPIFDVQVAENAKDVIVAFDAAMNVAEKCIRREKEKNFDAKKTKQKYIKSA